MFLLPYSLSFGFTELTSSIGRRIWFPCWKTTANRLPPSTGGQPRDHLCCIQYTKDCQEKIHFTGAEGGTRTPTGFPEVFGVGKNREPRPIRWGKTRNTETSNPEADS